MLAANTGRAESSIYDDVDAEPGQHLPSQPRDKQPALRRISASRTRPASTCDSRSSTTRKSAQMAQLIHEGELLGLDVEGTEHPS
ncbi:MAG: hypothetical protein GY856_48615 [bacterium]|nr:hypothetical protein [bacterium]